MANRPRIAIVLPKIIQELQSRGRNVFDATILSDIFQENKDKWRLPLAMDVNKFLDALAEQDSIEHTDFTFPGLPSKRLFYLENVSVYDLSAAILPKSYLSHYSAVTLWGLTEQIPKTIYITQEQSNSPSKQQTNELEQQAIDQAFKKPQRLSETIATFKEYKIILLRGKFTKNLGIDILDRPEIGQIRVTDIERTLIDIAVRPSYSGGIFEVLKAYRQAKEMYPVSVNKLSGYLNRMNFIYPYHQAIGFYLEAAGNYKQSQINILRSKPRNYDFYLTYEMQEKEYSKDWNIYYPKGMI